MKQRTIVFEYLSCYSFPLIICFVIAGFNIYILNVSSKFCDGILFKLITRLKIQFINFQKCQDINFYEQILDDNNIGELVLTELSFSNTELNKLGMLFDNISDIENKIKIIIYDKIEKEIAGESNFSKILCWINSNFKSSERVYIFVKNSLYKKNALKKINYNCINLYPIFFTSFIISFSFVKKLSKIALKKCVSFIKKKNRGKKYFDSD